MWSGKLDIDRVVIEQNDDNNRLQRQQKSIRCQAVWAIVSCVYVALNNENIYDTLNKAVVEIGSVGVR